MKTKILLLILALSSISCAKPSPEKQCGFTQNVYGQNVSWKMKLPVVLKIDSSVPEEFVKDIQAAAKTWNDAAKREVLQISATRVNSKEQHKDGNNIIYWLNTWDAKRPSEQAVTSVYWIGDQIFEADVRINNANFTYYTNGDLYPNGINMQALLTHEFGHVLGLAHADSSSSNMYAYLANFSDRITLSEQDVKNLNCQY